MDKPVSFAWQVASAYFCDAKHHLSHEASQKISGYLRSRSLGKMAKLTCDPLCVSKEEFRTTRQLSAFFKKNADFTDDVTCTETAKRNFLAAERQCRITNKRLDHFYVHPDRLDPDLRVWLAAMESSIATLVGDIRSYYEALPGLLRVTGGATEDRPRRRALPYLKISGRIKCPTLAGRLLRCLGTYFGAEDLRIEAVDKNRISLVNKNWETHRTIACEPKDSLPIQLTLDSYLKRRLRRWGINLSSQARNQFMALIGSLLGTNATIDLRMASDTAAFNAVAWLFPFEWFELFKSLRSVGYDGPFGTGVYAKFSSMGNGYTFVLETIMFAAACKAVGCSEWTCYGDDIIVEPERVADLRRLLRFLGFSINMEKTFTHGPFRESCGADWWLGDNITPFYLRHTPKTHADWCHVVNSIISLGWPGSRLWALAYDLIDKHSLPLVPFGEDSTLGIWIDAHTAWNQKILYVHDGIPQFAGLIARQPSRPTRGWRSDFLWHLAAGHRSSIIPKCVDVRLSNRQGLAAVHRAFHTGVPLVEGAQHSLTAIGHPRYRLGIVGYSCPPIEAPPFLWAFADALPRRLFTGMVKRRKREQARLWQRERHRWDRKAPSVQFRSFYPDVCPPVRT